MGCKGTGFLLHKGSLKIGVLQFGITVGRQRCSTRRRRLLGSNRTVDNNNRQLSDPESPDQSMNYLAHAFLSDDDPEERLGSLLADFTRGRLQTLNRQYTAGVIKGITLHRRVDRFTDDHPLVFKSRQLFSGNRRRYAGIILDVLYDHFLSRHWERYSPRRRQSFIDDIYSLLEGERHRLPPRMQRVTQLMTQQDWLGGYWHIERVGQAYDRLSLRLRRPNGLLGAVEEVQSHYAHLEWEFNRFFPDLLDNLTTLKKGNPGL